MHPEPHFLACLVFALATPLPAADLATPNLTLRHDPAAHTLTLARPGRATPALRFQLPAGTTAATAAGTLTLSFPEGHALACSLPADRPFAVLRPVLTNRTGRQLDLPSHRLPPAALDLGIPAAQARALGTAGLTAPDKHPGSYVFLALADPATRAGLVAGWLTFECGDGALFSGRDGETLTFAAQTDHGRCMLEPGARVAGESLALGLFDDARLGLEEWADFTAATNKIRLRPQLSGYCTWYSQPHGGASDETHIRELSAFAARELKPYGFDYVQIDDYWQDGQRRHGPAKVFERVNPKGPYPSGMQAAATAIRSDGLVPGIWYMPFAGDQDDPWFADKQHWFVRTKDDKVYFTSWGGGSLDLTHPEVQTYVRDLARRIGRDWGYGLFKLDGLWTGLANAQLYVHNGYQPDDLGQHRVHDPSLTPFEAYRKSFRLLREGAGEDVFILGCNISQNMRSFGAAIGMVDAMRIGPDNGPGWDALQRGPWHGSNRWFLHRRIWYNDPDPLYVRAGMPLDHARVITSWVAVTGTLHASSEWLPGLPPERLDLIRRALPPHPFHARPVDVFEQDLARIWVVSNEPAGRHVVALFNWDAKQPARIECDTERLGLPAGKTWVGREFWSGTLLAPFQQKLTTTLAPASCQVIMLRESAARPIVLASSRHITQGLTDLGDDERWDPQSRTLSLTTKLVAGEPTRLTIVAAGGHGPWIPLEPQLAPADRAAGATAGVARTGELVTLTLRSPDSRSVRWQLPFRAPDHAAAAPPHPANLRATDLAYGRATLAWDPADADTLWELRRDHGPAILLDRASFTDTALSPGTNHVYQVRAARGGPAATLEVKAPARPQPGPVPPAPAVHLADLKPLELTSGWGKAQPDRSVRGKPLRIAGEAFPRGLGTHANSVARYALDPAWRRFVAVVGLDDDVKGEDGGTLVFAVQITSEDGSTTELARSPVLRYDELTRWHFDLPLPAGAREIRLATDDAGDGVRCDHADWANAGFLTAP